MEFDVTKTPKDIMWYGLRTLRLDGFATTALCSVLPKQLSKRLVQEAETREKIKDSEMVKGLGEITLQANNGKFNINPHELDPAWLALKARNSGVLFEDVFDPAEAALLEQITPTAPDNS